MHVFNVDEIDTWSNADNGVVKSLDDLSGLENTVSSGSSKNPDSTILVQFYQTFNYLT